jgi:hypothetical protein
VSINGDVFKWPDNESSPLSLANYSPLFKLVVYLLK